MATKARYKDEDKGKNSTPEVSVIQQPGEVIAPKVPDGLVEKIAEEIYGFKVVDCKQLDGYDDKNYHIRVSPSSSNSHITSVNPQGYVMKVMNSIDSERPGILYAQMKLMNHLQSRGIATQEPVLTVKGEKVAFYQFPASNGNAVDFKTHAVLLRTFLPGQTVHDVTLTRDLCFKLGCFQGSLTKALQDFSDPFYDTFDCLWSLNNIPRLKDFAHVITDVKHRRVIVDVIEQFTTSVLPRRSEIRAGFVHGDTTGQNILVRPKPDVTKPDPDAEYVISGVIDFQEAARTHPLYDLAIMIAHVTLQATTFDPLEVGGHIVAGYQTVLDLPELELSLLRVAAAGRLVQSLVLGAYNYSLDPSNQYLLTTAQRGWHVLHALWDTPPDRLYAMWDHVHKSYRQE